MTHEVLRLLTDAGGLRVGRMLEATERIASRLS
jgi:hypothetical protein